MVEPPALRPEALPELASVLEHVAEPAILLGRDYRILAANSAYVRKHGAHPGGRRCFEVSHGYDEPCDRRGEACPMARAVDSGHTHRVLHVHQSPTGPDHVDVELRPIRGAKGEIVAFIEILRKVDEASADARGAGLVGRAPAFSSALALLRRVADRDLPVLLLGESGTGKELMAKAIHDGSRSHGGPFVPVECSGLSESLFESELFGHERGAFTGAAQRKVGLVEAAAGGTLFLDEIGDVQPGLQVKLLRLLETHRFRRVGGTESVAARFRLVCATHRDLAAMVDRGTFRQDLFYRLNTFPIRMPALRERREDIELLALAFLEQMKTPTRLHPAALRLLEAHSWPGNVRELKNVVKRAVVLADGDLVLPQHLPYEIAGEAADTPSTAPGAGPGPITEDIVSIKEMERRYIAWSARRFEGERRALAERLGVSERTLYRKLAEADSDEPQ